MEWSGRRGGSPPDHGAPFYLQSNNHFSFNPKQKNFLTQDWLQETLALTTKIVSIVLVKLHFDQNSTEIFQFTLKIIFCPFNCT